MKNKNKNKKKQAQSPPPQAAPVTSAAQTTPSAAVEDNGARAICVIKAFAAVVVFVLTVIGAVYGLGFDPFGWKEGHLTPLPPLGSNSAVTPTPPITLVADTGGKKESYYLPFGADLPTPISFDNDGRGKVVIRQATFTYSRRFKTPPREVKTGAVVALPLNFYKPVKPGARTYSLTFRPPKSASVDDYVAVEVALVDKKLVGWSYVGTLKLYYNRNNVVTVPNVVVDVLAEKPKPPEDYAVR